MTIIDIKDSNAQSKTPLRHLRRSTTTKIENYDALILGAFIKYHYIWIYNGVFSKGSFFVLVFLISWRLFKVSLLAVAFIRITGYSMTLYSSVIVVIFHGAYIR